MPETTFDEIVDKYVEMNAAHPFMEGNGRSTRIWLDMIFKKRLKMCVDWSKINKRDYLDAMIATHTTDSTRIRELLRQAMTDRIGSLPQSLNSLIYIQQLLNGSFQRCKVIINYRNDDIYLRACRVW